MNKNEIRKIMLNKRKNIADKEKLSTIIVERIINLDIYKQANVIALYKSLASEVNMDFLISQALLTKEVLLPRIIDDKMTFIALNRDTAYEKSNIGILEPIGDIYTNTIDLIIVPGVAFDKKNNRLGFGKGYYDKYLKNKSVYKIGICFEDQLVDELPTNFNDIPMDMVITDKRVLKKV